MTATVTAIHQPPAGDTAASYSAPQTCLLASITYRQLDYWTRVGLLRPAGGAAPGTGHSRRYSESEVDVARTGKRLLDAGFTVDAALKLARQLVESGVPVRLAHGLVVIDPSGVDG